MGSLTPRSEAEALLVLDRVPRVGLRRMATLVGRAGSARAALEGPVLAEVVGRTAARAARDPEVVGHVRAALRRAREMEMAVVTWADPEYPERLRHLADPPPVLFLRGRTELLDAGGVTIVGARRATARGRRAAHRLSSAVARAGAPVVSGLALGVDGAAHEGALDVDGDTVAVLGRGADAAHPRSHARLFERILERGLLVSEFLPGAEALPHHFPRRNRILAALADVVVVVEAARRSGSLITVEHALDLGIDVYAVPGPIDEAACAGSNALLRDGALPLVSIAAFLAELGLEGPPNPSGALAPDEAALIAGLDVPRDAAELAAGAGLPVARVLSLLSTLELRGWVEQLPGLRFRRAEAG